MNKPFVYRVGLFILGPIFRRYYKPEIIGVENLNVEGNKLIASNHIHLYDQCNTLISTKEFIVYMAKKEYFDSWKTRWFFKGVGCIPVNREIHDQNSKESALKVLSEGGSVGIFPEGTRNNIKPEKLKELYNKYKIKIPFKEFKDKMKDTLLSQINFVEKLITKKVVTVKEFIENIYDIDSFLKKLVKNNKIKKNDYYESYLLEFKYGTVSLAQKTSSYIVPSIITGDYKHHSDNLIIRYGTPFKVDNMDLESANKLLRKKEIELLKENLKGVL